MNGLSQRTRVYLLYVMVIAQGVILVGEYLNSVYPLWYGKPVQLAIEPVDPRSLFRGNYVRLNYAIGTISSQLFPESDRPLLKRGQKVYISLQKNGNVWIPVTAHLTKPETNTFIRGRITSAGSSNIRIRYGIEAYFAPREKAQAMEKKLRWTPNAVSNEPKAIAVVQVAPNGKAAISEIRFEL